jgi:hypothetical protein
MTFAGERCPEFHVNVVDAKGAYERVAFTHLLEANTPTIVDFYDSG